VKYFLVHKPYDHLIDVKDLKTLPKDHIYTLSEMKLEVQKECLKEIFESRKI
jgi:hypothetical protein